MATWGGEANASEEKAGGGGGNFTPAPRGIYTIQVADYKDGLTKGENGKPKRPMVVLECEVADEGEHLGKKVWVTIVQFPKGEKMHGLMLHNLHAFGIELNGSYEFDTNDLQGAQARALLGVKPYTKVKDGRSYTNDVNWVEELYTKNHPEPTELPSARVPREDKPAASTAKPSAAARTVFKKPAPELEDVPF